MKTQTYYTIEIFNHVWQECFPRDFYIRSKTLATAQAKLLKLQRADGVWAGRTFLRPPHRCRITKVVWKVVEW